jgi:competence protein ComFC
MLDDILSIIAPHHCCGCDTAGSLMCGNCKYNITSELKVVCIVCNRPTASTWLCENCKMPYEKAFVVGDRNGALQRLIGLYKFERAKSAYKPLGDLLLSILPEMPASTVIVPIPTTNSRIRERGYDHMYLIARYIAQARGHKCQKLILRKTNTKQRHSNATKRDSQAKNAFYVQNKIDTDTPYLIIDDVKTTGATIKYASQALRDAGAKHVWVAVIAKQTLD